jgi:hypothetical protein
MSNEIAIALIGGLATIVASLIAYFKDLRAKRTATDNTKLLDEIQQLRKTFDESRKIIAEKDLKVDILKKLAELGVFNELTHSVDRIFEKTRADRFLILFSMNGTHELRAVSVAFELRRNPTSSGAIVRYRDVEIDSEYRELIYKLERDGVIDLVRKDMKQQILKDFFTIEGLNTIKLSFVERRHLDADNDIIIFGTLGAEELDAWSDMESAVINSEYEGTIKPIIRSFF